MALAEEVLAELPNVKIVSFDILLIKFIKQQNISLILRGLRAMSDFEYEFQLAAMNKQLGSDVETVFLTASEDRTYISSSIIKEIALLGGDVSSFVHSAVKHALQEKLQGMQ